MSSGKQRSKPADSMAWSPTSSRNVNGSSSSLMTATPAEYFCPSAVSTPFASLFSTTIFVTSALRIISAPNGRAFVEMLARESGVRLTYFQEAESYIAIIGMVSVGMGVTIVLESMSYLFGDSVTYRPLAQPEVRAEARLFWSEGNTNQAVNRFRMAAKSVSMKRRRTGRGQAPR